MKQFLIFAILGLLAWSCSKSHRDIAGPYARQDFDERYAEGMPPGLDSLLNSESITPEEKEALIFLYAYMPLNDATDYSPEFFLENVRASLQAAEEMPWGKNVPDREFRHFVLPVRTNNENIDSSRVVFYKELRDRVKDMTMEEAILEVNHWCHEKVTYKPSDSRTNSPLASVCSATGRCGEESTFGVAALRAVGIPARQIYTPRWAHTDDNHAWVEVWADGKWHFLGACEPEAVLDLGWFNEPASRGMLMSTGVFGHYDGPEEQLFKDATITRINVTSNYAPVDTMNVQIVAEDGQPVDGAEVRFCIYNYADFYPAVVKTSDSEGRASLLAGYGDMIIWASKDGRFGIAKANRDDICKVTLSYGPDFAGNLDFDIVPPPANPVLPEVSPEAAADNDRRKAHEDSIRIAYTSTFFTPEKSAALAQATALDAKTVNDLMSLARGNWPTIEKYITDNKDNPYVLTLLQVVSDKDLNDITAEVLYDHINNAKKLGDTDEFSTNVLNPRVSNEKLTPYRSYLGKWMEETVDNDPEELIRWISDNIKAETTWNPQSFPISPLGVLKAGKADAHSRDIFFVAAARSAGIPARINSVTSDVEYLDNDSKWHIVNFGSAASENPATGFAKFSYKPYGSGSSPKYYSHFSISKINDGVPQLLEYDEGATADELFKKPVCLAIGQYMLVTGRRLADGSVLARAQFFVVDKDKTTDVNFDIRTDTKSVSVIGNFDSESLYKPLDGGDERSILSTTGRGYYVLGFIKPSHEPSAHALNDISALRPEIEGLGCKVIVLLPDGEASRFEASHYPNLPSNVVLGIDPGNKLRNELSKNLNINSSTFPIFVVADTFNRVVWQSQGYDIGLGEKLSDLFKHIKE